MIDRHLLLLMPRPPPRRPLKRAPPQDVYPSSMSVEFVSFTQDRNGRVTKKRVIEKTKSDTRPIFDIDHSFPPANADPLQVDIDGPAELQADSSVDPKQDPVKRVVSVSLLFSCHVRAPHSHAMKTKLAKWLPYHQQFLIELLRLEAPPSDTSLCLSCQRPATYRCLGCFSGRMTCQKCLISSHAETPLHSIQVRLYNILRVTRVLRVS